MNMLDTCFAELLRRYPQISASRRGVHLEVEARLHVLLNSFVRIRDYLLSIPDQPGFRKVQSETIDLRWGTNRYTATRAQRGYSLVSTTKEELWSMSRVDHDLKFAISIETSQPPRNVPSIDRELQQSEIVRTKSRTQFVIGEIVEIDITAVSSQFPQNRYTPERKYPSYEVEFELLVPPTLDSLNELRAAIEMITPLIYGTTNPFSLDVRDQILNVFNSTLRAEPESTHIDYQISASESRPIQTLSHVIISDARNLKIGDCVDGGLVGGKYQYTITLKADGIRRIMMIHTTGIWFLYPPMDLDLVIPIDQYTPQVQKLIRELSGTIFDGEEIPVEKRTGSVNPNTRVYIPIDLIGVEGHPQALPTFVYSSDGISESKDQGRPIQTFPFLYRLEQLAKYTQVISAGMKTPPITITPKIFLPFDSYPSLGNAIQQLDASPHSFATDGYVITPNNAPYLWRRIPELAQQIPPLWQRTLACYPEVCKLKPWHELTIDLMVERDGTNITLITNETIIRKDDRSRRPIVRPTVYQGSFHFPFNPATQLVFSNAGINLASLQSGVIVEFGPRKDGMMIRLEPRRVRSDKYRPNNKDIVDSVWDDINNPLKIETFKGETNELLFESFNAIKRTIFGTNHRSPCEVRALFDGIPADVDLIDLGSGRGGDLHKMRHLNKIVCVEPNEENWRELESRAAHIKDINGEPMSGKIVLIRDRAENSERIIQTAIDAFGWRKGGVVRPLYITMMLSLSFFFKSEETLQGLITTLQGITDAYERDVVLYIFTIEKERTLRVVRQHPEGEIFTIGKIEMKYTPPNEIYINIPNSIVSQQTEYLVDLDLLSRKMGVQLDPIPIHRETFMSENEINFASMYLACQGTIKPRKLAPETTVAVSMSRSYLGLKPHQPVEIHPLSIVRPISIIRLIRTPPYEILLEADGQTFISIPVEKGDILACLEKSTRQTNLAETLSRWLRTPNRMSEAKVLQLHNGVDPRRRQTYPLTVNYYSALGGTYSHQINSDGKSDLDTVIAAFQGDPSKLEKKLFAIVPQALGYGLHFAFKSPFELDAEGQFEAPQGAPSVGIVYDSATRKYSCLGMLVDGQIQYTFFF